MGGVDASDEQDSVVEELKAKGSFEVECLRQASIRQRGRDNASRAADTSATEVDAVMSRRLLRRPRENSASDF